MLKKVVAPRLFGTNGIRGVVGKDIDVEVAYNLGRSLAVVFQAGRVLVGRDGRHSSLMLHEGVIAGLLGQGTSVEDCGMLTTPALQFLVKQKLAAGGVMVTASHNPPEYNGFKVIDADGVEIPRRREEKVEYLMQMRRWKTVKHPGARSKPEGVWDSYFTSLKAHLHGKSLRGLRAVVDVGNGVSTLTTPRVLRELGCDVVTINDNIDGRFPGRPSEPRPETLSALSSVVKEARADFGVAHDGDGDRAIFADELGTVHWGDRTFALIEDEVLKERPSGKIVTPLNSSMAIGEIARKRRGRLVLTKVGSIFVSRVMLETGAVLGGEENGGVFYAPHHAVRDGTMAALLVARAVVKNKMSLSRLLGRLPRFFMAKEKFDCKGERSKQRTMAWLGRRLRPRITSRLDGIKVGIKGRGWVLVRPSGTEPLVRLYAEGTTESHLSELVGEFRPLVLEALKH